MSAGVSQHLLVQQSPVDQSLAGLLLAARQLSGQLAQPLLTLGQGAAQQPRRVVAPCSGTGAPLSSSWMRRPNSSAPQKIRSFSRFCRSSAAAASCSHWAQGAISRITGPRRDKAARYSQGSAARQCTDRSFCRAAASQPSHTGPSGFFSSAACASRVSGAGEMQRVVQALTHRPQLTQALKRGAKPVSGTAPGDRYPGRRCSGCASGACCGSGRGPPWGGPGPAVPLQRDQEKKT